MGFRDRCHCFWLALLVFFSVPRLVTAGEIVQYFPADGQEANRDTQWRVVWGIESHAGGSKVLYIKEAFFSRARGEREIKVLGDSRLAEIFVPYNGGTRIYDISGFNFSLIDLMRGDLGPGCIKPGQIYAANGNPASTGPVAVEIHDDHLRWMNTAASTGRSRRGQNLLIWSVLGAGNYRYIMLYIFRDDGQVGFRLGATAHNLFSSNSDNTTHLHSGCWRVNIELGNQANTSVSKVRLDTMQLKTIVESIDKEQRIPWQLDQFTRLRIASTTVKNTHDPASYIGYELLPWSSGVGHYFGTGEKFTQNEFWVIRDAALPELRCRDLDTYERGESLTGGKPVLWHLAAVNHTARDEDFGKVGYNAGEGVAITAWAGFDLKPRSFFGSTPLYP